MNAIVQYEEWAIGDAGGDSVRLQYERPKFEGQPAERWTRNINVDELRALVAAGKAFLRLRDGGL